MFNIELGELTPLIFRLMQWEDRWSGAASVSAQDMARCRSWLDKAWEIADSFEIQGAQDRIHRFTRKLTGRVAGRELATECATLRQAIEDGLKTQFVYRYNTEQAALLLRLPADWQAVLDKFPSAQGDAESAVDCWALSHWTASVFHSMRVVELGLAAMAKEVNVNPGVENWQNIIDQIEAAISKERKSLPRGVARNDRLQFLSEAAKEVVYFKDGWRNFVSHRRIVYDQHQARSVLEHVRSFMGVLSQRLSE